jgi:hypothetical protein
MTKLVRRLYPTKIKRLVGALIARYHARLNAPALVFTCDDQCTQRESQTECICFYYRVLHHYERQAI